MYGLGVLSALQRISIISLKTCNSVLIRQVSTSFVSKVCPTKKNLFFAGLGFTSGAYLMYLDREHAHSGKIDPPRKDVPNILFRDS